MPQLDLLNIFGEVFILFISMIYLLPYSFIETFWMVLIIQYKIYTTYLYFFYYQFNFNNIFNKLNNYKKKKK